jgi:hypothetical protein
MVCCAGGSIILNGTNYIFLTAPSDFNYLAATPGQVGVQHASDSPQSCQGHFKRPWQAPLGFALAPHPLHLAWQAKLVMRSSRTKPHTSATLATVPLPWQWLQGCPQFYVFSSFTGTDKQAALLLAPGIDIWVQEITIAGSCPYKNSSDQ